MHLRNKGVQVSSLFIIVV